MTAGVRRWWFVLVVGARMSGRGDRGMARVVLCVMALFICGYLLAATLALPRILDGQGKRAAQLQKSPSEESDLLVDRSDELLQGRRLVRFSIGVRPGSRPEAPPWLGEYPTVGQTCVSSALSNLIRVTPRLKDEFGQPCVSQVGNEALVAPDALVAVTGVRYDPMRFASDVEGLSLGRAGFGSVSPQSVVGQRGLLGLAAAGCVFVLAPAAVLIGTCARIAANARARRLESLLIVGVRPSLVAWASSCESGLIAACAGALGALAWAVSQSTLGMYRIFGLGWWGQDAAGGAWTIAATPLLLGIASLGLARVALGETYAGEVPTARTVSQRRAVTLAVWCVGLGLLVAARFRVGFSVSGVPQALWFACFVGGFVAVAFGLARICRPVARISGAAAARGRRYAALATGGHLLRRSTNEVARVGNAVALVTIIAAVGIAMGVTALATSDDYLGDAPEDGKWRVELRLSQLTLEEIEAIPGVNSAIPFEVRPVGSDLVVVASATCSDARELATSWQGDRVDGQPTVSSYVGRDTADYFMFETGRDPASVEASVDLAEGGSRPLFDVLVPPGTGNPTRFLVSVDEPATVSRLRAADPTMIVSGLPSPEPTRTVAAYKGLVAVAALGALTLLGVAALAPSLSAAIEHTRAQLQLENVGLSTLSRSAIAASAHLPALLGMWGASSLVALLIMSDLSLLAPGTSFGWGALTPSGLGLTLAVMSTIAITIWSVGRHR